MTWSKFHTNTLRGSRFWEPLFLLPSCSRRLLPVQLSGGCKPPPTAMRASQSEERREVCIVVVWLKPSLHDGSKARQRPKIQRSLTIGTKSIHGIFRCAENFEICICNIVSSVDTTKAGQADTSLSSRKYLVYFRTTLGLKALVLPFRLLLYFVAKQRLLLNWQKNLPDKNSC